MTERNASSPFPICVLADDPFGPALDQIIASERIYDRPVVVHRIREASNSCRVLFVPKTVDDLAGILADVGPGILTVGETDQFLEDGGIIAFIVEDRRVRFDVNQRAALRASLQLSSKLLKVARRVRR